LKHILSALPVFARDLFGIAGASLVSYGAGLIYRPAGFITGGILLIAAALLLARAD